jgi:hypothetical protein
MGMLHTIGSVYHWSRELIGNNDCHRNNDNAHFSELIPFPCPAPATTLTPPSAAEDVAAARGYWHWTPLLSSPCPPTP